jgi:hypothetical protein
MAKARGGSVRWDERGTGPLLELKQRAYLPGGRLLQEN